MRKLYAEKLKKCFRNKLLITRSELNLTQEDTLKFAPGNAELQVRIIDNSNQALASKIYSINICSILKDGIIE